MGSAGKVDASRAHGEWLRTQRQARGWSVPEMRRRLREAAKESGDNLPANDCLSVMIHRWEDDRSGISERYRLHFCRAFQIPIEDFGHLRARPVPTANTAAHDRAAPPPSTSRPRNRPNPADPGWSWIEQEILTTGHESIDHAQQTERRDAGDASLEHLHTEIVRLSDEYETGEPLTLFFEMRRIRDLISATLDRKLWPRDQSDLYFLLGCLHHLMASAADALGNSTTAEELARAGLAYALAIGHRPLAAQLRIGLAVIALYADQPERSADMAARGLHHLSNGPNGAQLHLLQARAAAQLGDTSTLRQAIAAAADARDRDYTDDLTEIGGEFSFSRASHHYYTGSAIASLSGAEADAIAELGRAIELYAAGPEPDECHSLFCTMIARADLASAWVRADQLDAAVSAVGPVIALPVSQRISNLSKRLSTVRSALAEPRYQGSAAARDFDEQIEDFCRDTITTQMRTQPASPNSPPRTAVTT